MRRATLLTMMVALIVALAASAAVAKNITGTAKGERLTGTNQADRINARDGNDRLYGRGGDDRLIGSRGNDLLSGSTGDDDLFGGLGRDQIQAAGGDDEVFARGESPDRIFCGNGFDVAHVSLNDIVGGASVGETLSSVTSAEQDALSCEVLVVNGLRVPLGAIAALPTPLEADVSLLLEEFLRDGSLSPEEIADLEEVFALILQIDEEDDPGALEELLGDLGALLDGLLGGILG